MDSSQNDQLDFGLTDSSNNLNLRVLQLNQQVLDGEGYLGQMHRTLNRESIIPRDPKNYHISLHQIKDQIEERQQRQIEERKALDMDIYYDNMKQNLQDFQGIIKEKQLALADPKQKTSSKLGNFTERRRSVKTNQIQEEKDRSFNHSEIKKIITQNQISHFQSNFDAIKSKLISDQQLSLDHGLYVNLNQKNQTERRIYMKKQFKDQFVNTNTTMPQMDSIASQTNRQSYALHRSGSQQLLTQQSQQTSNIQKPFFKSGRLIQNERSQKIFQTEVNLEGLSPDKQTSLVLPNVQKASLHDIEQEILPQSSRKDELRNYLQEIEKIRLAQFREKVKKFREKNQIDQEVAEKAYKEASEIKVELKEETLSKFMRTMELRQENSTAQTGVMPHLSDILQQFKILIQMVQTVIDEIFINIMETEQRYQFIESRVNKFPHLRHFFLNTMKNDMLEIDQRLIFSRLFNISYLKIFKARQVDINQLVYFLISPDLRGLIHELSEQKVQFDNQQLRHVQRQFNFCYDNMSRIQHDFRIQAFFNQTESQVNQDNMIHSQYKLRPPNQNFAFYYDQILKTRYIQDLNFDQSQIQIYSGLNEFDLNAYKISQIIQENDPFKVQELEQEGNL